MSFNQRMKNARESKGMTLKELANKIGKTEATVQRYESGEIKNLKNDTIEAIAQVLEISPAFLMGWSDTTPYYKLTEKEKLDIGKEVDKLLEGMYSSASVNFYGEPMTDEGKEKLRVAIQMAMELNKEKAKKKFTPKKYRNE